MKNLRNLVSVASLLVILLVSASTARAGLLVSDFTGGTEEVTCSETKDDSKADWGVIINGLTGVIINGFTSVMGNNYKGVIINDATQTTTDCGVIING